MRFLLVVTAMLAWSAVSRNLIATDVDGASQVWPESSPPIPGIACDSKTADSWAVLEGSNFRVWHSDYHLAQRVLAQAERSRIATLRDWLPDEPREPWQPRCDIYLYGLRAEHLARGRMSPNSAGQAIVVKDNHRVLRRKIMLDSADPRLLDAVVPHEVAHIVLGGYFPNGHLPSWADEGIAMLNEPLDRQREYLRQFGRWDQRRGAKDCEELILSSGSVRGQTSEQFYGRSFLLTSYLVRRGGRGQLIRFLESAMATDDATALQQIYGITDLNELDENLTRFSVNVASEIESWSSTELAGQQVERDSQ